jgi:hypothetical protein
VESLLTKQIWCYTNNELGLKQRRQNNLKTRLNQPKTSGGRGRFASVLFLSMLATFALTFGLSLLAVAHLRDAPDTNAIDGVEATLIIDRTIVRGMVNGSGSIINIPDNITMIATNAFLNQTDITSVTIGKNVRLIEDNAFSGLVNATSLHWNATNARYHEWSAPFQRFGANNGATLTIGDGVESLPRQAFYTVSAVNNPRIIGDIAIPGSMLHIGDEAFRNAKGITSVSFGIGVTNTGVGAFRDSGVSSVELPNTIQEISQFSFFNCVNLMQITLPTSVTSIDNGAFGLTGLTSIVIPDGVTSIGNGAFSFTGLTSIVIPDSVTSLGGAFDNCANLTDITMSANIVSIDSRTFQNTAWSNSRPNGAVYLGNVYLGWKGTPPAGTHVTVRAGTTVIAGAAFTGNIDNFSIRTAFSGVTLPAGLKHIGGRAFASTTMTNINIPDSVISIGAAAFMSARLTNANLGPELTYIGAQAFWSSSVSGNITIPSSVTYIGNSAFSGTAITGVTMLANSIEHFGEQVFFNTPWLANRPAGPIYVGSILYGWSGPIPANTTVNIAPGTTMIASSAVSRASADEGRNFVAVNIPDTVTHIGNNAFSRAGITSITIPDSVVSIGEGAFRATWLTSVTIPGSVLEIEGGAFSQIDTLTSVIIQEGVTTIGAGVFSVCPLLAEITFPSSIEFVGSHEYMTGVYVTVLGNADLGQIWRRADGPKITIRILGPNANLLVRGLDRRDIHAVYVPAEYLYDYRTAPNWALIADLILPYGVNVCAACNEPDDSCICPCPDCATYPCVCPCPDCTQYPCVCVYCGECGMLDESCVCCGTCKKHQCICCVSCNDYPCKCCQKCGSFPCDCCVVCNDHPCKCCQFCDSYPCVCVYCGECGLLIASCVCCADCAKYQCVCVYCNDCNELEYNCICECLGCNNHPSNCVCCKKCDAHPCVCCTTCGETPCVCVFCIDCGLIESYCICPCVDCNEHDCICPPVCPLCPDDGCICPSPLMCPECDALDMDCSCLDHLVSGVDNLDSDDFTDETWRDVQDALERVQDAETPEERYRAYVDLKDAIELLDRKQAVTSDPKFSLSDYWYVFVITGGVLALLVLLLLVLFGRRNKNLSVS